MTNPSRQIAALAERAGRSADKVLQRDARRMLARLNAMPMSDILAKVPGDTIPQKAAAIGVTRTAVWYWVKGISRPRNAAAGRIARLTGIGVDEIRGRA